MSNLTDLLPAGAGGKQVSFVASGTIGNGVTVGLNSDGTVTAIASDATPQDFGSQVVYWSNFTGYNNSVYDPVNNKVIITYRGNAPYAVVGTVSGTSISFGTPVLMESVDSYNVTVAYDSVNEKIVSCWYDGTNDLGKAIVGTVSGTSISFGSPVTFPSLGGLPTASNATVFDAASGKIVVLINDNSTNVAKAQVLTVSGTSISFGTPVAFDTSTQSNASLVYDSINNKTIIAYAAAANSNYGTAIVATVSGTSISFGSKVVYQSSTTLRSSAAFDSSAGKIVIAYRDSAVAYGKAVVGTVSGTSISFGSSTTFNTADLNYSMGVAYDANADKIVISYGAYPQLRVVVGTVSGTSITFDSPVVIFSGNDGASDNFAVYDAGSKKVVLSYANRNNSYYGTATVFQNESSNSADFIGISDAAISDTASGSVTIKGGIASNTDITTPPVNSAGSTVVFDDGGPTTGISSAYDPDTAKVVNVFCTTTANAIVGTVSGTSITYGSAVQINADNSSNTSVAYDTANDKFVIAYEGASFYGYAVVGTVSGTSISFGTPVVFYSGNVGKISVVYDVNAGKTLIMHTTGDSSTDRPTGVVGTVSGTSISFGSPTEASSNRFFQLAAAYDANAQKTVVVGYDFSGASGAAFVATISGTSVSFGSPTNFLASAVTNNALSIVYNSTDNKVIVGYGKSSDNKGYLTTGTVSGTSISFAGETEFSGSTTTNYISLAYKASGNILGMVYNIGGSTTIKFNSAVISGTSFSFGTEQELAAAATDTTAAVLDGASGNFVASYGDDSNNSDGTTNVASVSTSLVTNSTYYVQTDGTLSTTASDVLAGKALSSTSINLDYTT